MATSNYTKRAEDSLNLLAVAKAHITTIKQACKAPVASYVIKRMQIFTDAKVALEHEIEKLRRAGGLFTKIKNYLAIRQLREKLSDVNRQIVEWVNLTYRHFFSASA